MGAARVQVLRRPLVPNRSSGRRSVVAVLEMPYSPCVARCPTPACHEVRRVKREAGALRKHYPGAFW